MDNVSGRGGGVVVVDLVLRAMNHWFTMENTLERYHKLLNFDLLSNYGTIPKQLHFLNNNNYKLRFIIKNKYDIMEKRSYCT